MKALIKRVLAHLIRWSAPWATEAADRSARQAEELRELGERLQRLETKVDSLRRELEGEIDESRDDLRRTAELYDLVFKRLAGLSSSDSAAA